MQHTQAIPVIGTDGQIGVIPAEPGASPSGHMRVELAGGREVFIPTAALSPQEDGSYLVSMTGNELNQLAGSALLTEHTIIPVITEELIVNKRQVATGGIRVRKTIHEHEEVVSMPLLREHVDIRRFVINRDVDGPLPIRREGDTTIIPVVEEVLVVEKRMRLKEEIHITRRTTEENFEEKVTLQREEAAIERLDAQGRPTPEQETAAQQLAPEPTHPGRAEPYLLRRNKVIREE